MHEQSETGGTDAGYANFFGRATPQAGQPLPLVYGFEKPQYPSLLEALQAASMRSDLTGRPDAGGRGGASTSDYLRQQPMPNLVQLLQILWQIRSSMNTGP